MKRIVIYVSMLLILVFIVRCKDDSSSTSPERYYFPVHGVVYDKGDGTYSPGFAKGVKVAIDKDTTVTDAEGYFILYNIIDGTHTLSVSSPKYEPYSRIISVPPETNLRIDLDGKKGDYFPIQERSQIKFNYHASYGSLVNASADSGVATWSISSAREVGTSKVYDVAEKIIYLSKTITPVHSEKIDSTSRSFTISISNTNIISFSSPVLEGVTFNRFLNTLLEQNGAYSFHFNNTGSAGATVDISLIKNIGFSKIAQSGRGFNIAYELKQ